MSSYKSTNFSKTIGDVNKLKLHNNQVKQWYLRNFCSSGKTLLDVGVGRLNDMKVWKTLDFEKFIGIEPSSDSLSIANSRVEGDNVSLYQGSAQDDWAPFLKRRKPSHILFNWTFHYGNTSEDDLKKVLDNIKKYSASHARICMLSMDGDQIFNNLKDADSFTYGYFSVTKGSYTDQEPKLFGQDVIIKFKGVYGLEEGVREFIVPINKLIQAMDSIGFRLLYKFNFLDIWDSARANLSPDGQKISGLYNGLIFETKPEANPLPNLLSLSDNVYTKKAPKEYRKPWFPSQAELEYMRLTSYFIPNPSLYVAIYKDMTPNPETLKSLYDLEQKSFSTFIKFMPGKELNCLLYEFDIEKVVPRDKLYCVRVFVLHKTGNIPDDPAIIPIHVTSNVPEFIGSFTNKEHDRILHYQNLQMVKRLHKTRPFHGGSWEVADSSLPKESKFPKAWDMLNKLSPKDRYKIIIFSGSILEILGTTVASDMDLIVWNTTALNNIQEEGIDATVWNGTRYLPEDSKLDYKAQWLNIDFPKLYGAQNMEETIFNPAFHFYWKGMKFISLGATIAKLESRARPSGYTDLLILEKLGVPINFPIQVPKTSIMQGKIYDYTTNAGRQQLLGTIQFYMKTWHNQIISIKELEKKLILPQKGGGFKSRYMLDTMFPEKEGVDYTKLMMTEEGEYSITKRPDSKKMLQKILSIVRSTNKHITDLTGNVGGDTIMFGLHFKSVDSIEYNQENFEALKNNVEVFGLKNVNLHFGDSTRIYNWHTDILYIDPPWGGPDYKEKENLDLYLGDVRIDLFINTIMEKPWKPQYIFLKLPRNYNFERFSLIPKVHKFAIRNFTLIGIVT